MRPSPSLHELPAPPDRLTIWPWTRGSRPVPPVLPDGSRWPSISIVMPSFNQAAYLENAMRSVLLQGYPALELIVMDGGSTDGSRDILEKYDPWLTYWQSAPDHGPAAALNRGFAHATGSIYGFLNADDFYLADSLAQVATRFAQSEADVLSGHGYFARASGELGVKTFSDPWNTTDFRYGACVLLQPATFFRRSAFERVRGFRQSGRLCWDMELWADLADSGARFGQMDAFLAAFRIHEDSITGRPSNRRARRMHAQQVMARTRGRPEARLDRVLHYIFRLKKFSRHPLRTVRQRAFFFSILGRWSV